MATEVDKRVVEMQFDNKDFEKNCQASLTTLEKLKMALNFDGAKGLESMGKAASKIDLSNVAKGAEAVQVKFSAMNIAGMTMISELTKGFLNLGKTIWNMSLGQAYKGGMARTLKIEQARFQMKALAKNLDEVKNGTITVTELMQEMHESIDAAVTGTAYGYDAAAAVASQLMASGRTDAKRMKDDLLGIAGAAAMTGRSFEDIGNIFTTVASNGKLMTMQLRQFSASGLNLSATLAKELGKTEQEINDMVQKGLIDFDTFSSALTKAFGESAQEADKTWSGVTSNIRAQLSRIGQKFTDPFVEKAIPALQELKAAIKRLNTVLDPISKTWNLLFTHIAKAAKATFQNLDVARLRSVVNGVENILVGLIEIIYTIKDAFREVFPPKTLNELHELAMQFDIFSRSLIPTEETLMGLKNIVKLILQPLKLVWSIAKSILSNVIKPMASALTKVLGAILRLGNALEPIIQKLNNMISNSEFLDNLLIIFTGIVYTVIEAVVNLIVVLGDLISYFTKSTTLYTLLETLQAVANVIGKVIISALYLVFVALKKVFSYINAQDLETLFVNIRKGIDVVIGAIALAVTTVLNLIRGLAESGTVIGDVVKFLQNIAGLVKDLLTGQDIEGRIKKIGDTLADLGTKLKKLGEDALAALKQIDAGKVIIMAFAIALIFLIFSIKELLDQSSRLVKNVNNFTGIFSGIKKALGNIATYNPVMQILLGFAVAIAAFTSSLVTLSRDVDPARLKEVSIVMGAFAAGVVLFAAAMHFLNTRLPGKDKEKGINLIAIQMLALAGSMLLLASAAKQLASLKMDLEAMAPAIITISSIMILFAALAVWMSQNSKALNIGGLTMLAYALAVKILASTFNQIGAIKIDEIREGLLALIAMMGALAGSMALMSIGTAKASAISLLGFVLSLMLLLNFVKKIAYEPFEKMKAGLKNLAILLTPFIVFLVTAAAINLASMALLPGLAKFFIAFDLTILLILGVVHDLASMKKEEIVAAGSMLMIMGIFLTKVLNSVFGSVNSVDINASIKKAALMKAVNGFIISMGVTMVLLAIAMKAAKGVDLGTMALIGLIVAGLSIIFKWVIEASAMTEKAKVGPIITLIVGIMGIISAIAVLTLVGDMGLILTATIGIAVVLSALAAVIAAYGSVDKKARSIPTRSDRNQKGIIGLILSVSGIILAFASLIYVTNKLSFDKQNNLTIALAGLAGCLLAIGLFVAAANRIKDTKKHDFVSNIRAMGLMMIELAGTILIISAAVAGLAYVTRGMDPLQIAAIFAGVIITYGLILALFTELTKYAGNNFDGSAVAKASVAILAASAAFVIIAGAIAGMAKVITNDDYNRLAGIVAAIAVPLAVILGGLALIMSVLRSKDGGILFGTDERGASESQIMTLAKTIVIATSAIAIIAASIAGLAVASKYLTSSDVGKTWALLGGALAGLVIVFGGLFVLLDVIGKRGIVGSEILKTGLAIAIATSSIVIICGAITTLVYAANRVNFGKAKTVYKMFNTSMILLAEVMTGLFVLIKFTKYYNASDMLFAGGAIALAASSLVIIAGAITAISAVKVDQDFGIKAAIMITALGMVEILLAILIGISTKVSGINILAAGAAIALAASSVVIIAAAIALIGKALVDIQKYMGAFVAAMTGLIVITAVISGLVALGAAIGLLASFLDPTATAAIYKGMITLAAAFAIFGAFVFTLSASVTAFAKAVEILNSTELDRTKIATNFEEGFKGMLDGIKAVVPELLTIVSAIVAGVFLVLLWNSSKSALVAVAWVTNFLLGLAAAMPAILAAVDLIAYQINEHFTSPESIEQIKSAAEKLGDIFGQAFIGAIKGFIWGGGKGIAGILGFNDEYMDKRGSKWNNFYAKADYAGTTAKVEQAAKELIDKYREVEEVTEQESEEIVNNLAEMYTALYNQAERAGENIEDNDVYEVLFNIAEQYDVLDEFKDKINGVGDAYEEATYQLEELNGAAQTGRVQMGTLTRDSEDLGTSVTETSDAMADLGEKTTTAVNDAKKAVEGFDVTELMAGVGENLVNMVGLDSSDVSSIKEGLKNPAGSIGDFLGTVIGVTASEKAENTLEYWMADAMTKIVTDERAFSLSGGSAGYALKWQTVMDDNGNRKYRSQAEYANAMLDDASSLSYGGTMLEKFLGPLKDVTEEMENGTGAADGLSSSLGGLSESSSKAAKKFGEFYNGLKDSMTNALKNIYDEVREEDPIGTEEMLKRMEENTKRIGKWARQLRELAAKGMSEGLLNELKDMGPQAADKVDAFARMTSDQLERANQMFAAKSKLPEYATDEIVDSYKEAGFYSSLGFAEGVDPTVVETAFRQLGMEGLEALEKELGIESPSKKTMADGVYATEGLAKGLTNVVALGLLKTSVAKVANALLNNLKIKLDPKLASKIGYDFIVGLANGFNNATSIRNITDRVSGIANGIIDKFRHTWDEHSPSRKAEELGLFFMRGLGVGLEDGSTYLERQTGEKADDILQSMKDKLYGSLMNVTDEGVYEPVIRPVFDLSALDEGWNYINSWFAEGRTISLAGNIQRLTPTTKENNDVLDREILDAVRNLDVDGVRNELNGIRTDISELQAAVTNLQVVMDTGALVGQLVNPMDNALGAKALFNGRGRY